MTTARGILCGHLYPRSRRGSVILFVLGVILLAAFLLAQLIARASGELLVESRAARESALRAEAYSALEVTLAVLADVLAADGSLHAPAQGWADPLGFAGYAPAPGTSVEVAFEDETGKLSLPTADAAVLLRYAEVIGLAPHDAERLVDALLGWTRPDHLPAFLESDPARYGDGEIPYAPPARALRSFEELRSIAVAREVFFEPDGRWSEVGERFRSDASLHRFDPVNVNSARPAVLVALGLEPDRAMALAEGVLGAPGSELQYFRAVADAGAQAGVDTSGVELGAAVECLRIRVVARQGASGIRLEAVVRPAGGSARPAAPAAGDDEPPVEPRAATSKRVDYPFRVLELRESSAPAT